MSPADIPDTAPCYVPGYGETTVGAIRAEQPPKDSPWEADLRRLEIIATQSAVTSVGQSAPNRHKERHTK